MSNTIKIKPMLTLTYKDVSENLSSILISDNSDFIPTNFTGNGLVFTIETLQGLPSKDETNSNEAQHEISKILKLMADNNCDFLMLREG